MTGWVSALAGRGGAGPGTVHSVFARVTNLAWAGGDMLSLAAPEVPLAPNGARVRLGPAVTLAALGLAPGQPALWWGDTVELPVSGLTVALAGAEVWEARPSPVERLPARRLAVRVAELRRIVAATAREAPALALLARGSMPGAGEALLVSRLRAPFDELGAGARRGQAARVAAAARRLAGLGPGLTPSGDDLLVGFVAAFEVGGAAVGVSRARRAAIVAAVVGAADARMSELGRVWLRHAARGEVAEPVHRLLGAMLGARRLALEPLAAPLLALGATSGPDLAVGLLAGLDAVLAAPGPSGRGRGAVLGARPASPRPPAATARLRSGDPGGS